jgi:hypothetical protein
VDEKWSSYMICCSTPREESTIKLKGNWQGYNTRATILGNNHSETKSVLKTAITVKIQGSG